MFISGRSIFVQREIRQARFWTPNTNFHFSPEFWGWSIMFSIHGYKIFSIHVPYILNPWSRDTFHACSRRSSIHGPKIFSRYPDMPEKIGNDRKVIFFFISEMDLNIKLMGCCMILMGFIWFRMWASIWLWQWAFFWQRTSQLYDYEWRIYMTTNIPVIWLRMSQLYDYECRKYRTTNVGMYTTTNVAKGMHSRNFPLSRFSQTT